MDLRLDLYALAARYRLDPAATRGLLQAAAFDDEPPVLARRLPLGLAVLAAALGGLGLVLWIAANWGALPRMGQFALLQVFIVSMALAALARPALRAPCGLLAFIGIGGLFAFFGQTYQTGADAWQLFALWAALGLPLALAARSDVLWAPWSLVGMTAISLWVHAHAGHRWRPEPDDTAVYLIGWTAALALVAGLAAPLQRFTGAGLWSLRIAATLAVTAISLSALGGLFASTVAATFWIGLLLLAGAALVLGQPGRFDIYVGSVVALALCTLLVAGLVRAMARFEFGALLLVGLAAAGLMAGAVAILLALHRREQTARLAS